MTIQDALKTVRKELIIKDEPLKAYNLLVRFRDEFGIDLKEEIERTRKMIVHYFEPDEYDFTYNGNMDKNDFEQIEPLYFATDAAPRYWRYQWVLNNLEKEKAKSYIDLGCYVGSMVTTAAKRGIKAIGVDFTRNAIEIAQRRAKDVGVEAEFYQGDVTKWKEKQAEHVSSMEVIEHVIDPVQYVNHMADLATTWCYVSTPNGPYGNGEGNLPNWDWRGPTDRRGHLRVFTIDTMKEMLYLEGMEIAELFGGEDGLLHAKFRRKNGSTT